MWSETGSVCADRCFPRGVLERSSGFLKLQGLVWGMCDGFQEVLLVSEIHPINPVKTRLSFAQTLRWADLWNEEWGRVRGHTSDWAISQNRAALFMTLISVPASVRSEFGFVIVSVVPAWGTEARNETSERISITAAHSSTADAHYTRLLRSRTEFGFYCGAALKLFVSYKAL